MSQAQVEAPKVPFIASAELWAGPSDTNSPSVGRFVSERLWNSLEAAVVTAPPESEKTPRAVLSMPWHVNDSRQSCLLVSSATQTGTFEVWHLDPERKELRLSSGYFGRWDEFRRISSLTRFSAGAGLPGLVWKTGCPVLLEDLSESKAFLRAEAAKSVGLEFGLGLPVRYASGLGVIAILSSKASPMGRSVDLWRQTSDGELERMQGLAFAASSREHAFALSSARKLALEAATRYSPVVLHPNDAVFPIEYGFAWPSRDEHGGIHVATVVG